MRFIVLAMWLGVLVNNVVPHAYAVTTQPLQFTEIRQNQVGYHPKTDKIVWLKVKSDQLQELENEGVLLKISPILRNPDKTYYEFAPKGLVVARPAVDTISQDLVLLNLSSFKKIGRFNLYPFGQWIQSKFLQESAPFTVSPNVFQQVGQVAMRALYSQRSGQVLLDGGIGLFQNAGHIEGILPVGGWYEGSTYDKHLLSHVMVSSSLMTIYERNPEWAVKRGRLAFPKSEDTVAGVPDILHETAYGLRWILKMQDVIGKGFYTGIGSDSAPDVLRVRPEFDTQARRLLVPSQVSTAAAVATLAQAARVYKDINPDLSLNALLAAQAGWKALEAGRIEDIHTTQAWEIKQFKVKTVQPFFRETFWSQSTNSAKPYILWAGLELGHTTQNKELLAKMDALWKEVNLSDLSWRSPLWHLWTHPVLKPYIPPEAKSTWLKDAETSKGWSRALQTPWVSPFDFKDFPALPASNDAWVRHALQWVDAYELTKDKTYLKAALDVFNYLMGFNKWNVVMMSGNPTVGGRAVQQHPCNMVARSAGIPLPGLLLKGVTPDFPSTIPFQDNSTFCQWTATHISWQGHLADLMFRLDQVYSPELAKGEVINAKNKEIKKLKLYNEVEQDELRRLKEQKEKSIQK
jgi:hypothetical protein